MQRSSVLVLLLVGAACCPTIAHAQSSSFSVWNNGQGLQNLGRARSYVPTITLPDIRYQPLPQPNFAQAPQPELNLQRDFPFLLQGLARNRIAPRTLGSSTQQSASKSCRTRVEFGARARPAGWSARGRRGRA